jgi:hypothetical protein
MHGSFSRKLLSRTLYLSIASICLTSVTDCHPATDLTLEETFDQTYPLEPNATLRIAARDGSIRIYGAGHGTREIRIEAVKKAYRAERLEAISVQVAARPDSVSIETIYPAERASLFSDRSGTIDYVITVPQTIKISQLELTNGEVVLEEMRSEQVNVRLENGRVFAHNCFGNVNVNSGTGNVALVWDWWENQKFTIAAHIEDGNMFAYIPSDSAFLLKANARNGKIGNDFTEQEDRHAEPINSVEMAVNGGSDVALELEAQDGNIKVAEHNP